MATIAPLNFTKDWTDPSDFPTTEPDEAQARADMQELHNQTREYINNTLVPAIPSGVTSADQNMRGYRITEVGDPVEDSDAVNKKYVDDLSKSIRTTATITAAGWNGAAKPYVQVLYIDGVEPDSIVEVAFSKNSLSENAVAQYGALLLHGGQQDAGLIQLRCYGTKNTVDIPIDVIIRRD